MLQLNTWGNKIFLTLWETQCKVEQGSDDWEILSSTFTWTLQKDSRKQFRLDPEDKSESWYRSLWKGHPNQNLGTSSHSSARFTNKKPFKLKPAVLKKITDYGLRKKSFFDRSSLYKHSKQLNFLK